MGKRVELEWSIGIDKAPEEVFDYLVDLGRHHEWAHGDFRVENVSDTPLEVGSTWTTYALKPPSTPGHRTDTTVTALERPTRFAITVLDDGEEHYTTYVLTPDGAGTLLRQTLDLPKPGGAVGLAFNKMIKPHIESGVGKTLEVFKAGAER